MVKFGRGGAAWRRGMEARYGSAACGLGLSVCLSVGDLAWSGLETWRGQGWRLGVVRVGDLARSPHRSSALKGS